MQMERWTYKSMRKKELCRTLTKMFHADLSREFNGLLSSVRLVNYLNTILFTIKVEYPAFEESFVFGEQLTYAYEITNEIRKKDVYKFYDLILKDYERFVYE